MIYEMGWILSAMTIFGALLNAYRNKWGFVVWIITNIGWIIYNISTGTYNQIPVWIILSILSIIGFYKWHKEENQLKIPSKPKPEYKPRVKCTELKRWQCPECKQVLVSNPNQRHQIDTCNCGKTSVDLEQWYCRTTGKPIWLEEE